LNETVKEVKRVGGRMGRRRGRRGRGMVVQTDSKYNYFF